jgi:tryptophan-rich sensory protein
MVNSRLFSLILRFKQIEKMNKITKILTVVVTCLAIGYLSGTVTRESILTWYPT